MSIKVDVLISGAGPVGLYFANLMVSRGHSIYIVDMKPCPTNQSRAFALTARTMEILESKGFAEEVRFECSAKSGIRIHDNGIQINQLNSDGDTNYPFVSALPQSKIEDIFARRLEEETDTRIHWETEFVSYTQHEDCIVSVIRNINTNEESIVESTYIVGADGTHSRVRKENPEWTFKGVALATRFALADVILEEQFSTTDKANGFIKGSRFMGLFDFKQSNDLGHDCLVYRIVVSLDDFRVDSDSNEITHGLRKKNEQPPPTLEFMQQIIEPMVSPKKIKIKQVVWSSFFSINERMANGFRRGGAFLIGDAAHCHSPAGGQGLNLGIQDADNLAWKMSMVLRGVAKDSEKLLDSYNAERMPHVENTIKATSSGTKIGLTDTAIAYAIRSMVIKMVLSIPFCNSYIFKNIAQQNVTMSSELIGTSDKGLLKAGVYLPYMSGLKQSYMTHFERGKRILSQSLQDIIFKNQEYIALFVTTGYSSTRPSNNMGAFWRIAKAHPVRRFVIQSNWHVAYMKGIPSFITREEMAIAEQSFYSEERMDSEYSVTKRVGLYPYLTHKDFASPQVLVLIRPDLYVVEAKLIYNEQDIERTLSYFTDKQLCH